MTPPDLAAVERENEADWHRMMARCHHRSPGKARRHIRAAEALETEAILLKLARSMQEIRA